MSDQNDSSKPTCSTGQGATVKPLMANDLGDSWLIITAKNGTVIKIPLLAKDSKHECK